MSLDPQRISNPELDKLVSVAREAASHSYSPYSNFRVGAAVLSGDGVYKGCNIENASYGLTLCAERVAIFNAISSGEAKPKAIAISCLDAAGSDISSLMPCGACLQVMAEFGTDELIVILDGGGIFTLNELLPLPFRLPITTNRSKTLLTCQSTRRS